MRWRGFVVGEAVKQVAGMTTTLLVARGTRWRKVGANFDPYQRIAPDRI